MSHSYLTLQPWLKQRLEECSKTLQDYNTELDVVEKDTSTSENERFLQIKKIREEINKVGVEIDNIKKEISLLNKYSLN